MPKSRFSIRVAAVVGLTAGLCLTAQQANAEINNLKSLTQTEFKLFAQDMLSALSYKALTPAEPLGITGFDVGVGVTVMQTQSDLPWKSATGSGKSFLSVPRISVQKGLPFDVDVGGFYATVPGTGIDLIGAEIKYAIVSGSTTLPAIAVRGAATRLLGLDQLDFESRSLELTVSKGLLNFTPYAGVGKVWSDVTPDNAALLGAIKLRGESPTATRAFVGLNFNIFLGNLVVELDKTGENTGASAKLGIRF